MLLHSLQPAPIAQRSQREPQVDVGLIQACLWETRPQERYIEQAPVERDQERELSDVGGELVKVDSLDE